MTFLYMLYLAIYRRAGRGRLSSLYDFDSPMCMRRQILRNGSAVRARKILCVGIVAGAVELVGLVIYRILYLPMP